MYRFRSLALAYEKAKELYLDFGLCVFDGWYYVGTKTQLLKIGVIIKSSKKLMESTLNG